MANNIELKRISRDSGAYVAGTTFETEQQGGGEHRPVVKIGNTVTVGLPTGAATEQGLDDLLTELRLKADLTETQPISAASLPLPSGASTLAEQQTQTAQLQAVNPLSSVIFDTILITYTDATKVTISKVEWKLGGAVVKTLTPTFGANTDTWVKS